ncbi:MAG: RidA family protein [Marinomonas colpomeniae]
MATIERIEVGSRMSRIVKHNGTIYLCGQVGADANTDITEQTQTMLEKVNVLLEQAGSGKEHILSATIYIRDMKDFSAMNAVWDAWVPEGFAPARACVEARMARAELLVEVSVVAAEK